MGCSSSEEIDEKSQLIADEVAGTNNKEAKREKEKWSPRGIAIPVITLALLFFTMCSESLLTPFFPPVAYQKGLSQIQIGLVFGSYELAKFFSSPVVGLLVARVTPLKLCAFGAIVCALTCFAFGAVYYVDGILYFILCLLVRLLAGVGNAVLFVASMSLMLKTSTYQTGTVVGLVETCLSLGISAGRAIGAGLFAIGGYTCPFFVIGGILTVLIVMQILFVPNTDYGEVKKKNTTLELFKIPGVIVIFLISIVFQAASNSRLMFFSVYLAETFHTPAVEIGLWLTPAPIIYLLCVPITSAIVNRGYIFSIMVVTMTISIVLYLLIGPSPLLAFVFHGKRFFWLTVSVNILMSFTRQGAFVPPFKATTNLAEVNGYPKDCIKLYGMVAGITNCANSFGMMAGPMLGGILVEKYGYPWSMTVMSGLQLFTITVTISYLTIMKINKWPIAPEDNKKCEDKSDSIGLFQSKVTQRLSKLFKKSLDEGLVVPATPQYTEKHP